MVFGYRTGGHPPVLAGDQFPKAHRRGLKTVGNTIEFVFRRDEMRVEMSVRHPHPAGGSTTNIILSVFTLADEAARPKSQPGRRICLKGKPVHLVYAGRSLATRLAYFVKE